MLDFGALPPEVNSARMYVGSGSTPLVSAASAWSWLAGELESAATGYDAIITQLTSEEWLGPASAQMAAAATPYLAWMHATATQAEQTAAHARAAANAYQTAFSATVPPQLVAANRAQLLQAVSTNILGQNTPVITQLEAQYGEMWAQDVAAMYGYASQSAPAAEVTPFTEPTQTTNPAGQAMQAAAVSQAAATSAGVGTESTQAQVVSSVPPALQALASPAATAGAAAPDSLPDLLKTNPLVDMWATFVSPTQNSLAMMYRATGMATHFQKLIPAAAKAAGDGAKAAAGIPGLEGLLGGLAGAGGAPVSAGMGAAAPVGGLSVPPAWPSAAGPVTTPGASPLPMSTVTATPEPAGAGNLLGGMPLAGAGAGAGAGGGPRYGFRPTVMMRPPFAG